MLEPNPPLLLSSDEHATPPMLPTGINTIMSRRLVSEEIFKSRH